MTPKHGKTPAIHYSPILQLPEPCLCHLRAASPSGEAPDWPGRRGLTLKRRGRREREEGVIS
jgi:hypothetical protein